MKVYLVAGEPSGDLLASGLMAALRRADHGVEFRGVGGESMTAQGLESRFDIADISVMGIFEVLPRLRTILRHVRETADDILAWQPDVVVTVDSWGFASQLLTRLRKAGTKIPLVHYVAPQVWAWKKGRAKNIARLVDRLMMLLPYEGQYFEKYGLQCDFVGHPVVERTSGLEPDGEGFRMRHGIRPDARVVCVLPGSRRSEVGKLLPVFRRTLDILRDKYGDLCVVIPTVGAMEERVRKGFEGVPVRLITGEDERYNAFSVSEIAIAKSGTVSLELTALRTPHMIAYTFNPLTNMLVRMFVKIRFANLINILAGRGIIPEFVLHRCRPSLIAACAEGLLDSPAAAAARAAEAAAVLDTLRPPGMMPSERAAQIVVEVGADL